jgi:hypothetical protein
MVGAGATLGLPASKTSRAGVYAGAGLVIMAFGDIRPSAVGGREAAGLATTLAGRRTIAARADWRHASAAGAGPRAPCSKKFEPWRDLTHTRLMITRVAIVIRGGYRAFPLTAVSPISKMRQGLSHARAG